MNTGLNTTNMNAIRLGVLTGWVREEMQRDVRLSYKIAPQTSDQRPALTEQTRWLTPGSALEFATELASNGHAIVGLERRPVEPRPSNDKALKQSFHDAFHALHDYEDAEELARVAMQVVRAYELEAPF